MDVRRCGPGDWRVSKSLAFSARGVIGKTQDSVLLQKIQLDRPRMDPACIGHEIQAQRYLSDLQEDAFD